MIKDLRRIVRSGELMSDGVVLLETPRMIKDALAARIRILRMMFRGRSDATGFDLASIPAETEIYEVSPELFESLVSTETSQGVLAFAEVREWREEDLFRPEPALVIVVAGIQDPGNLGNVMRTAEAFGATGMILTEGTASPFNAKVIRASAGSVLRLPMLRRISALDCLGIVRRH
jgi:RNA methyltransferase, TrmH family